MRHRKNQAAIFLLLLTSALASLEEYARLELQNAEALFQLRHQSQRIEHFPSIQKLIFITPWNRQGQNLSVKYAKKIDYVSPCWYSLELNAKNQPIFQNQNNYDQQFVAAVREANPGIKVLPRVYLDGKQGRLLQSIGSNRKGFDKVVDLIATAVKQRQFDGIVWDSPYNLFQKSRAGVNSLIGELIKAVRNQIGQQKLIFFNMAHPGQGASSLQSGLYEKLAIDRLLIQNYDGDQDLIGMISKSIKWADQLQDFKFKLIMMLPFFTVKRGSGPMNTIEAVKSLQRRGVHYSGVHSNVCNFVQNKSQYTYYIPCYAYFKKAFQMAIKSGWGVGFWEGGNGLQNYYTFL